MQPSDWNGPWWAEITIWVVVNAVCVLQAVGFLSRIRTGNMAINHALGYVMVALAVPTAVALVALVRAGSGWRYWIGPAVYLAFVVFMVAVEDIARVEFRSPPIYGVLVPYLVLFFGSIVLMGVPMFRLNRGLWLVNVATSALLIGSMVAAMRKGVG